MILITFTSSRLVFIAWHVVYPGRCPRCTCGECALCALGCSVLDWSAGTSWWTVFRADRCVVRVICVLATTLAGLAAAEREGLKSPTGPVEPVSFSFRLSRFGFMHFGWRTGQSCAQTPPARKACILCRRTRVQVEGRGRRSGGFRGCPASAAAGPVASSRACVQPQRGHERLGSRAPPLPAPRVRTHGPSLPSPGTGALRPPP